MPLETNFNVSPYYDDYTEGKNFHRVLFRPGVAVQARELTQLQTILQNQIERFGDNIFRTGTIVKGCSLTTDYNYNYIKLKDTQQNGQPINLGLYSNTLVVQESSNLQSLVVNSITGLESTDPNLATLYIKYQNTGTGGEKEYASGDVVKVFNRDRTIEDVTVITGGSLYSNSDTVVFSGGGGTGATAVVTTDADGEITDISVQSKGTGYTTTPNVSITTSTGSGASLSAVNYISEITVATVANAAGTAAAVKTTEGVIYQKGFFVRVDAQEAILERYSNSPSDKVVGFRTVESTVNSSIDSTLLDLASGTPNYAAPGANRIKLTPSLTVLSSAEAQTNSEFLVLLEYQNGNIVKDRTVTQFNSVNREVSRRTYEESGNYVINTIPLDIEAISSNTTHHNLVVGAGVSYVNGQRIQTLNNIKVSQRKGTDTANAESQTINTQYGNYVIVDELVGSFEIKEGTAVNLRSAAGNAITGSAGGTPPSPGSNIGTAKVRALEYHSGVVGTPTCQYRLYLFDIKMSASKSFKDVKSFIIGSTAAADAVLNSANQAELKDVDNNSLVFFTGTNAVRELNQEQYVFRTSTNTNFTTGGNVTISFSGGNTLPYGAGSLTDVSKQEFILVPTQTFQFSGNNSGTITTNTGNSQVVGTSTAFTSEYETGDFVVIGSQAPIRISSISNNTFMTLANTVGATLSANVHYTAFPAYVPVDMTKGSRDLNVLSSTSLKVDMGASINVGASFVLYHNLENFEPAVRAKTLNNPIYVKLSTDSLASTVNGPWCLGIPDVLSIEAVYVGSSNSYSESTTNYAAEFELDSGQRNNYYGLAFIKKAPGSNLSLTSTNNLLVKVKCFTHSSGKYISTESYPVDDSTTPLPTDKIRTQDIPVYVSITSGRSYSLRDSVDCRPIVSNTAVLSTTAGSASIDPPTTETLTTGEKFFPSPSDSFECDIESYLNRVDRVVMDENGDVRIIEGVPSNRPVVPAAEEKTMDLAIIEVAPYPSLSSKEASVAKRPDLRNSIQLTQTVRYTMEDIRDIEERLQRLEYYSLLNTLEANTAALTIPSEGNSSIEVFKNGFFVDAFDNYTISDLNDGEYKASVNSQRSRLIPQEEVVPIDLKYTSTGSSNVVFVGDLVSLPYTEEELVFQPIANKERTLVEGYWSFDGSMDVIPRVDNYFDVDVTGTTSVEINIADPLKSLVDAQNEINKKLTQATAITNTDTGWRLTNQIGATTFFDRFTTETTTTSFDAIKVPPVKTSTTNIRNLLTSVTISPYIRPQSIGLIVTGLRPLATHYAFFDGEDVNQYCYKATINPNADLNNLKPSDFWIPSNRRTAQALTSDEKGELAIKILLPGDTFTTGEKEFLVMDVSSLASEESATSKAVGKFASFGTQGTATNISIGTKTFDLGKGQSFQANTFSKSRTTATYWLRTVTRRSDPLCQTFVVQRIKGSDYVYLTSVDVFFKQKDNSVGVSIELREVNDAGYPTSTLLPFSKVYKRSSQVSVSSVASAATRFTFKSPVCVKADTEYALVITPDANSPEYRVWTAKPGIVDVDGGIFNETWGLGTLFYSTSNRAFTPVQDEDLKFRVNRASFTSTSGSVVLTNGDYEFLTINAVSGSYTGGEDVAQMSSSYVNATLTTNTSSRVVGTSSSLTSTINANDSVMIIYGTSPSLSTANVKVTSTTVTNAAAATDFTNEYANGDFIRIGDELRQVVAVSNSTQLIIDSAFSGSITDSTHYAVTPIYDISKIVSANSTSITLDKTPSYTVNSTVKAVLQKVVAGTVSYYNANKNKLYLNNSSSSNSNFLFKSSNSTYYGYLVGDLSQAVSKLTSIDNIEYAEYIPLVNVLQVPQTTVSLSGTVTKASGGTATNDYSYTERNALSIGDTAVIKSRTNEISGVTITKSLSQTLTLSSNYNDTSPIVDINPSSIVAVKYNINNSAVSENTRYGNSSCKYISKRLALADGLDAEDIKVYLKAYRPAGTDVLVYAKILNSADPEIFEDKDWTPLLMSTSSSLYSSSLSYDDLKEYEYTFKKSPIATKLGGSVTAQSNTEILGFGTTFGTDLAANDLVKIVRLNSDTDYDIIPVASVSNNTVLTLSSDVSFSASACTIEKVTNPKEAFKYNRNNYVVRYHDSENRAYDGYKYMCLKIVLLSNNSYNTPQVDDVRAIAISV